MKSPKFVVVGYPRAGKTTLAELLSDELRNSGLPHGFADTSTELVKVVSDHYKVDVVEIRRNKEHWRPILIETGDRLTEEHAAALSQPILETNAIVAGVRRIRELEALRSLHIDLVVVWVHRTNHDLIPDNTEIRPEHCDLSITASDRRELARYAKAMVIPLATILNRRAYHWR